MSQICVIDDDETTRTFVTMALEAEGHEVIECDNAKKFVSEYIDQSFDLIVSDIYMPDMDGFELLRTIKSKKTDIPVIIVSGGSSYDLGNINKLNLTLEMAHDCGADAVIAKPIDTKELISLVDENISKYSK